VTKIRIPLLCHCQGARLLEAAPSHETFRLLARSLWEGRP
jgi:hypothetical protein